MTTTCASARPVIAIAATIAMRRAEQQAAQQRRQTGIVQDLFHRSACYVPVASGGRSALARRSLQALVITRPVSRTAADTLAERGAAERAQGHLQHDALIGADVAAVGVIGDVVQGNDHAIVDIADAELRFRPSCGRRGRSGPAAVASQFWRELERGAAENALAARQEAELRLGVVFAVEHGNRPAVEVGAAFGLELLHARSRPCRSGSAW